MGKFSIVVVDDHPIFRQGVVDTLSLEKNFVVVGQASDGEEGLDCIRKDHPEIAIIDINLPGLNGQQLTRQIVAEKLPTRVILLTAYDDIEQKKQAMRSGAAAYCTKDVKSEELIQIINIVASGGFVVGSQVYDSAAVQEWLFSPGVDNNRALSQDIEMNNPLSVREMEVLSYIAQGLSNKEIAILLGISHQTVKNHVSAILRKIGVDDRTQAAIYTLRRGWVRLNHESQHTQE